AELGLDYDAQVKSLANYEVSGEDGFCKVKITEPRKAGEIWIEGEGIKAYSSPACTLGALAELKGQGKKIATAYLFDTAQGIKLFASEAFYASVTKDGKADIHPFLLKKDAEAAAAAGGGKVLGFDDALKSVTSGRG
ncbi:MAG: ABC transporter substrate-binding protein, partial [Azorhizobium sp. 39-67-5]